MRERHIKYNDFEISFTPNENYEYSVYCVEGYFPKFTEDLTELYDQLYGALKKYDIAHPTNNVKFGKILEVDSRFKKIYFQAWFKAKKPLEHIPTREKKDGLANFLSAIDNVEIFDLLQSFSYVSNNN